MLETFFVRLGELLKKTSCFPGKSLRIDLIINSQSGVFRKKSLLSKHLQKLERSLERLQPASDRSVFFYEHRTRFPGDETTILPAIFPTPSGEVFDLHWVVIAGGDGTSRGVLISALRLPSEVRKSIRFFRLPLGTGNDASDSPDWDSALTLLCSGHRDREMKEPLPVMRVEAKDFAPHFSFNIASVGLDAYVADLTNRFKKLFPGNSYSLAVDLASFFYEWAVRLEPIVLELFSKDELIKTWNESMLLVAFGTTGHKTYGSRKRILPDDDNLCLARKLGLFTKLSYRKPFYEGTHRGLFGVELAQGDRLRIDSPVRLPLQMDGEVHWLERQNFPLVFSVGYQDLFVLKSPLAD